VISCGLERAKIGVAGDPGKRLRELQVGSPSTIDPLPSGVSSFRQRATAAHFDKHGERLRLVGIASDVLLGRLRRAIWSSPGPSTPEQLLSSLNQRRVLRLRRGTKY
jgi:hypothetical protein